MTKKTPKSGTKNEFNVLESELVKNFIKYWSLRKSNPFLVDNVICQIKKEGAGDWFDLIESNHKFRAKYGEEAAKKLIKTIEEENFTGDLSDLSFLKQV